MTNLASKLSKDPQFADVVGLYLDPPATRIVLSLDEKAQNQAFDRSGQRAHDYVQHTTPPTLSPP